MEEESSCVLLCPLLRVSGTIVHDMQHLSDLWQALIAALFARGETLLSDRRHPVSELSFPLLRQNISLVPHRFNRVSPS